MNGNKRKIYLIVHLVDENSDSITDVGEDPFMEDGNDFTWGICWPSIRSNNYCRNPQDFKTTLVFLAGIKHDKPYYFHGYFEIACALGQAEAALHNKYKKYKNCILKKLEARSKEAAWNEANKLLQEKHDQIEWLKEENIILYKKQLESNIKDCVIKNFFKHIEDRKYDKVKGAIITNDSQSGNWFIHNPKDNHSPFEWLPKRIFGKSGKKLCNFWLGDYSSVRVFDDRESPRYLIGCNNNKAVCNNRYIEFTKGIQEKLKIKPGKLNTEEKQNGYKSIGGNPRHSYICLTLEQFNCIKKLFEKCPTKRST